MPVACAVPASFFQRGSGRVALLVVLLLLALAAGGTAWMIRQSGAAPPRSMATLASSADARLADDNPSHDSPMIDALLTRARGAVAAQHLLAPAGNNAFELYLAVRQRDPANAAAIEALREVFPFAAEQAGKAIREGDTDEARRQLQLLAQADPGNYTLTLLRTQLEGRQAALVALASSPAVTNTARSASNMASTSASGSRPEASPADPDPELARLVAARAMPAAPPAERHRAPSTNPAPAATSPPPTPVVAVPTAPVLLHRTDPYYPRAARRARREGWVEVAFTVTRSGDIANVAVLDAEPKNVFDHAATSAVERWSFKPATLAGKPVAMRLRQRLDFRL